MQNVRVHGLRDIGLRFGWQRGEQADEDARQLIAQSLRPDDQVFRSGEESFTLLLPDMLSQNHALLATTRLAKAFEQPLNSEISPWHGRPIMGVAFFPDHGTDADQLCRRAEIAVDEAQRLGERTMFYQSAAAGKEIFYEELREAIELNRLRAYLQPVVDLKTGRVVGAESLARWNSPRHGEVEPPEFVQFAERSDLIWALTRWSINATLRHARPSRPGHHLCDQSFDTGIHQAWAGRTAPGCPADLGSAASSAIVAEITETALVNDLDMTVRVLHRLRDQGMRIAVDDFGSKALHRSPGLRRGQLGHRVEDRQVAGRRDP